MKTVRTVTGEGTVYCGERRRPIDVIACYGCDKLVECDLDSHHPKIVCGLGAAEEATPASP